MFAVKSTETIALNKVFQDLHCLSKQYETQLFQTPSNLNETCGHLEREPDKSQSALPQEKNEEKNTSTLKELLEILEEPATKEVGKGWSEQEKEAFFQGIKVLLCTREQLGQSEEKVAGMLSAIDVLMNELKGVTKLLAFKYV